MEPNVEQIKSTIGWVVTAFSGMIAGWFAAKGWFTIDQVTSVLNSPTLIGGAAAVVVWVWRMFVHKESSAVGVVAAMALNPASPVKGVIMDNTQAGRDLTQAVSSPAVAPAGSIAAASIAGK